MIRWHCRYAFYVIGRASLVDLRLSIFISTVVLNWFIALRLIEKQLHGRHKAMILCKRLAGIIVIRSVIPRNSTALIYFWDISFRTKIILKVSYLFRFNWLLF